MFLSNLVSLILGSLSQKLAALADSLPSAQTAKRGVYLIGICGGVANLQTLRGKGGRVFLQNDLSSTDLLFFIR